MIVVARSTGTSDALDREAAFVVDVRLLAALDDLRVGDRDDLVLAGVEDEQPLQDADLGGREADPARVRHQQLHPLDEPAQFVVELLDGPRVHLQRGVGILADLGERKPPPRLALRVALLLLDHLSFDLRHAVGRLPMHAMDPREQKAIMSQGAIRPETARDREERRILEADLAESPVTGKPLQQRLRNFRPDADAAVRALGGPTVWMRRLRAIEVELEQHERQLDEAWRALARESADPAEFDARAGATRRGTGASPR